MRSHVYGGRADDLDWLEMAGGDGGKEQIIAGGRGVTVTTDLDMVHASADRGRTRSGDSDVTATGANAAERSEGGEDVVGGDVWAGSMPCTIVALLFQIMNQMR